VTLEREEVANRWRDRDGSQQVNTLEVVTFQFGDVAPPIEPFKDVGAIEAGNDIVVNDARSGKFIWVSESIECTDLHFQYPR
jgi:hypothetical protein